MDGKQNALIELAEITLSNLFGSKIDYNARLKFFAWTEYGKKKGHSVSHRLKSHEIEAGIACISDNGIAYSLREKYCIYPSKEID